MIRVQLEYPDEQVEEIDALVIETRLTTRKDLFNNALTLFQWAVKVKREGRMIASVDANTHDARELVMPSLESIRP